MADRPVILVADRDRPDPTVIAAAVDALRRGGLVAFATETVYGLGADATDPSAVLRIFEAKGRPPTNPLIAHVADEPSARACVTAWSEAAARLAAAFWPGPLTLVLPRSPLVADAAAAGLPTVGVRVPEPPVARALCRGLGRPIAAPSANPSNGISPTRADHVARDLGDRVDLILDSGPTTRGLESTVLDLSGDAPTLLRPGPIGLEALERVLGLTVEAPPGRDDAAALRSPGRLPVHYAPRTPAVRVDAIEEVESPGDRLTAWLILGPHRQRFEAVGPVIELAEADEAARGLYAALRELDASGVGRIVVVLPPDRPEWVAVRDRILRATRPSRSI